VANLEGPEEEHVAENSPIRDSYLADHLSGKQWQYACFHLNVPF
jgi:hypothetical protein